jgi:hypothetical protein
MLINNNTARFYSTEGDSEGTEPTNQKTTQNNTGTNSQKTENQASEEINFAKLRKEFEKVTKERDDLKKAEDEAKTKTLEEQNEFKKLWEEEKQKSADYESQTKLNSQKSIVKDALEKAGVTPEIRELLLPSLLLKVEFADDNSATNLDSVIADLPANLLTTPPAQAVGSSSVTSTTNSSTSMTIERAKELLSNSDASIAVENQSEIEKALGIKL